MFHRGPNLSQRKNPPMSLIDIYSTNLGHPTKEREPLKRNGITVIFRGALDGHIRYPKTRIH